ncbi:hypothetical protein BGZ63DRAFT_398215 [Mariannaea sp. PMI_226]|nr:hypothetical protein BGZ63DRAFT_398215 [Mariannaea sp. PMI_226]
MSLLNPPSFSQLSRTNKRKLPPTAYDGSSQPSSIPYGSSIINPLSHSPGLVRQFFVAGLAVTDANPADVIPDFPHRGLDRDPASSRDVEPDSDVDGSGDDKTAGGQSDRNKQVKEKKETKTRKIRSEANGRGDYYEVLLQSIHHFLDQGNIGRAARAYGLLLQLRPGGKPVDIKRHNLWAIGAEILMREGEPPADGREATSEEDPNRAGMKRWGRAENMNKVKAYFDTLISLHPYDYKHPRAICAVDFWIAMLSCEIYNTHTEHVMGLHRVSGEEAMDISDNFDPDEEPWSQTNQRKEELRLRASAAMRAITKRMDELMREPPYSKNAHLLRLRAMAALYAADLLVPVAQDSQSSARDVQRARQAEQKVARDMLIRIVNNGGELDAAAMAVLNAQDESEQDSTISVYSSLPIRGL